MSVYTRLNTHDMSILAGVFIHGRPLVSVDQLAVKCGNPDRPWRAVVFHMRPVLEKLEAQQLVATHGRPITTVELTQKGVRMAEVYVYAKPYFDRIDKSNVRFFLAAYPALADREFHRKEFEHAVSTDQGTAHVALRQYLAADIVRANKVGRKIYHHFTPEAPTAHQLLSHEALTPYLQAVPSLSVSVIAYIATNGPTLETTLCKTLAANRLALTVTLRRLHAQGLVRLDPFGNNTVCDLLSAANHSQKLRALFARHNLMFPLDA